MQPEDYFSRYQQLVSEVDSATQVLWNQHHTQMKCQKGCASCCEKFSIFPIEFDFIIHHLKLDATIQIPQKRTFDRFLNRCYFLKDSVCTIYPVRPIICRTQGFPLLYQNSEGTAYELSVCKLNFKGFEPNQFHDENALFMPRFNSLLYLLNQEYIRQTHPDFKPSKRIPLAEIANYL